jgi:hypothetical protein
MKMLLPLSFVATLLAAPAFAECVAPANSVVIPDGATATKDALLAAQHAIKDYNAAVTQFADCLKTEQEAKLAAGGDKLSDANRQKINLEYAARNNAEVDKLQQLADKFNLELRAWKATQQPATTPKP